MADPRTIGKWVGGNVPNQVRAAKLWEVRETARLGRSISDRDVY
jgi:hypothetical protein